MTSLFSCSIFVSYLSCFMSIRLVEVNCNKIYLFRQYFIVIFIHTIFIKHYLVFAFFVLYLYIFIVFCTNSSFRYIFMPVYICNLLLANGSTSNNYSIFIKKCSCFQKRKRTQIREDTGINNVKDTDTEIIFVTVHTSLFIKICLYLCCLLYLHLYSFIHCDILIAMMSIADISFY